MTRSRLRTITFTAITIAAAGLAALAAASPATAGASPSAGGGRTPILCTSFDPGEGACEEWPGDPGGI